jgi:hypothetical protein
MFGPVVKQGIWRTRNDQDWGQLYNQDWGQLYTDLDKEADIKKNRLEWIGHVERMGQGRAAKIVFENFMFIDYIYSI